MKVPSFLREVVVKSPIWPLMRPRRIHVYGVGALKTGTKSLAHIFGKYRAAHEPHLRNTIHLIQEMNRGDMEAKQVEKALRKRDRRWRLEVEVSHLAGHFVAWLPELFPEASFILTVRKPRSWLRSAIDQSINNSRPTRLEGEFCSPWWRTHAIIRYGEQPGGPFSQEEQPLAAFAEEGVFSIAGYLSAWAKHNESVIQSISAERLLCLRTRDISHSIERIADFVGISPERLDSHASHVHKTPKKHGVLEAMDEDYISKKIDEHCGSVLARLDEELGVSW